MLGLLLLGSAHAAFLFGGEYIPIGMGALAWDDAGQLTGTLAGEYDGLVRPPLTAQAGWAGTKDALTGGFALVRVATATFADTNSYNGVGSTRLQVDYRRWLKERQAGSVGFYGTVGGYFVLPNAADVSDAYTPEEQAEADEGAGELRARIGGFGGQLGFAAQYVLGDARGRPAVALGLRTSLRVYRGQAATETSVRISTLLLPETAIVVDFTR